jgi:flagellar biosynthesis protein FlhF
VVALVGPTGVGKTTTIAKMAARYALRHGNRNVALVTTDNFRIGARDQLHTYGRILDVPVVTANDSDGMADAIESLSDRRLILIDTAGMGSDNERFEMQVETLRVVGAPLTTLLTLSATTEAAALERAIRLFGVTRPDACLLTKLDEAASLGASLSAVVQAGLPIAYLADGQRVPEDLQAARAHPLVERAAALLEEFSPHYDEAFMAMAYRGKNANARV